MSTLVPPLSQANQQAIERALDERWGLGQGDLSLEYLPGWDHKKLRLVSVATRQKLHVRPVFALLSTGKLVMPSEEGGLAQIVKSVRTRVPLKDCVFWADVSAMFGRFPTDVGALVQHWPVSHTHIAHARPSPNPIHRESGRREIVQFYTFNPDAESLFDCTLTVEGDQVSLDAKEVTHAS